jgi:hypothetical protein
MEYLSIFKHQINNKRFRYNACLRMKHFVVDLLFTLNCDRNVALKRPRNAISTLMDQKVINGGDDIILMRINCIFECPVKGA